MRQIIAIQKGNEIEIHPLENPEHLTIQKIIEVLNKQFSYDYKTSGGSKLPVLAFYSIYIIMVAELSRYDGCVLEKLGYHTTSDRTSKSAGDIEITNSNGLLEVIEIKSGKPIDPHLVRIVRSKVLQYNPTRYYILSTGNVVDIGKINKIINEVKQSHGCQIIINGIIPTLKYYLRLVSDPSQFIKVYSKLIQKDTELKTIHKHVWNKLLGELSV